MIRLRPPWLHRALDATSQWLNTIFLNGDPNESISGRAHREGWELENHGWRTTEKVIDTLFFWEHDHCYSAFMNDLERARVLVKSN